MRWRQLNSLFQSGFARCEEALLVGLFLTAFAVLVAQIVSRHLLPYPLAWSEELARFLFLWIVFLGAAWLVRLNGHVAITILTERLSPRVGCIVYVAMQCCILVFATVVCWQGADVAWKVRQLPTIAMEISSAWEYAAVPVGAGLIAVRTAFGIVRAVRGGRPQAPHQSLI